VSTRRLIVNADDLGQCLGINWGIADAADRGIVTSASLMVRWPAAADAVRWAIDQPRISIGLHVDLGEWTCRDGAWTELYRVVEPNNAQAVDEELSRQLGTFLRLLGRPPTHLDSHQHVHHKEPLRSKMLALAARLAVPLRGMTDSVNHCGSFYGQWGTGIPYPEGITLSSLLSILDQLPEGTTELGCHPGTDRLPDLNSMYRVERSSERTVMCNPALPGELGRRGIKLCSFADLDPRVRRTQRERGTNHGD
jgi:chitin disaccharide deacetylase